jgi:RNA polymerase sigma factor (sigma-70 family)
MNNEKLRSKPQLYRSRIYEAFIESESSLRNFLRKYTKNFQDIEDITQETILRALQAERGREIQEPRRFLFGIAKNVVRKEMEKKSRSVIECIDDFCDDEYLDERAGVEQEVATTQEMLIFWEAVASLSPQCQKVFIFKWVHGHPHKDIAEILKISVSTIEKHAAVGLKRCSEYMESRTGGEVLNILTVGVKAND